MSKVRLGQKNTLIVPMSPCPHVPILQNLTKISERYRTVTHARGRGDGGQGCRQGSDDDAERYLPELITYLHS